MKKILILIAVLFATTTTINAQEYNRWAISGEFGNQMVADESAVSVDEFKHFGLGIRYNLNEIVGLGLTGGYDFTSLQEEYTDGINPAYFGQPYDFEYGRVNLEGYINAFKAVDLYSKRWALLLHGGPGASFIKTNGVIDANPSNESPAYSFNHKETVLNLRGGASLLYKVSKRIALYGDFSTTANVNQTSKFDGSGSISNAATSALVSNVSVGVTVYLGKKDKDGNRKEHADWYVAEPIIPVINNNVTKNVTNNPVINFTQEEFNEYYESYVSLQPISEYVFFDHDVDVIDETDNAAKNAIYKIFAQLTKNPTWELSILGYASPTSSTFEYNQKLSERRTKGIKEKLVLAGLDESRIITGSYGKDVRRNDEKVHDIARRVELLITKN